METGQTCTFMVFLQKIGSNPHGNLSNYHSSRSQKYPWKPPNVGQKFNAWRLLAIFRRKTPRPAWTFPAGRGINNQKAHFRSAGLLKSSPKNRNRHLTDLTEGRFLLFRQKNPQFLPVLWKKLWILFFRSSLCNGWVYSLHPDHADAFTVFIPTFYLHYSTILRNVNWQKKSTVPPHFWNRAVDFSLNTAPPRRS